MLSIYSQLTIFSVSSPFLGHQLDNIPAHAPFDNPVRISSQSTTAAALAYVEAVAAVRSGLSPSLAMAEWKGIARLPPNGAQLTAACDFGLP